MLREYCDRCGKEIPADDRERKTFDISYEERYQGFAGARFTLCKECIEETGIKKAIGKARRGRRDEKPKDAIEQLTDLIKEFLYKLEEGESL